MEVLADWLAPRAPEWFLETHFGRAPFAAAGSARGALPLLAWPTLDGVLAGGPAVDVLTVAGGRLVSTPPPRSLADVRALMRRGVSTVVRGAERHDAGLRALADAFERALPGTGEVHVQLYATPGGTNSYGWHYDFEDVFIAQTDGAKDYYFRANTVATGTRLGEPLDFGLVRGETSPLMSSRLLAGDWLYLPRRWWHLVKCVDDALSISVGVMPLEALRQARRVPAGWSQPADPAARARGEHLAPRSGERSGPKGPGEGSGAAISSEAPHPFPLGTSGPSTTPADFVGALAAHAGRGQTVAIVPPRVRIERSPSDRSPSVF